MSNIHREQLTEYDEGTQAIQMPAYHNFLVEKSKPEPYAPRNRHEKRRLAKLLRKKR